MRWQTTQLYNKDCKKPCSIDPLINQSIDSMECQWAGCNGSAQVFGWFFLVLKQKLRPTKKKHISQKKNWLLIWHWGFLWIHFVTTLQWQNNQGSRETRKKATERSTEKRVEIHRFVTGDRRDLLGWSWRKGGVKQGWIKIGPNL